MKTVLYFCTGTGNSLWTARRLSENLDGTKIIPMSMAGEGRLKVDADCVGLVFPVHIWGLPHRVVDFAGRLAPAENTYLFAVAVNAGQVAATLLQLRRLLEERNLRLASGFSLCMPSNYIPWGGAPPAPKQEALFDKAREKIARIASAVKGRTRQEPEKGPWWQNLLFSWFYRKSFSRVPAMDKSFRADEKCNGCGICRKICPADNVAIENSRPGWRHRCEQCFACLQWCPQEAVQFGKSTARKRRYRHPEISLSDMLACVPPRHP